MLGLIVANVRRRRARTALTAAGIAVGVAAIVALLGLSAGLNNTAGQLVHLGKADLSGANIKPPRARGAVFPPAGKSPVLPSSPHAHGGQTQKRPGRQAPGTSIA